MNGKFPDDFLWGAATSSHQIEGDNFNSDWWEWEQAGNTEPSGKACDHYNRFKDDFRLAKELGHNSQRVGIEWSRLEKEDGAWDQDVWDHYKEVLDELAHLEIEPILTLNHFTMPKWLAHKGGWKNPDTIIYFKRFAVKALCELGSRVKYWITINEPYVLALLSYYKGEWPPQGRDFKDALLVIKHMLKAHADSYLHMKTIARLESSIRDPKIGVAKAVGAFHPCSPYSVRDRLVTHLRNRFYNHSFFKSAVKGRIMVPGLKPEKLATKNSLDFIGLNYYYRQFIHYYKPFTKNPFGMECSLSHHQNAGEVTDMGWEIYPEGLYEVVKSFSRYKLPIFITENGLATTDDAKREKYIKDHLSELLRAINEGAPVMGYLHWSLMDNFEWADGYGKRFGLIRVDYNTQERKITPPARYLESVIKTGKL